MEEDVYTQIDASTRGVTEYRTSWGNDRDYTEEVLRGGLERSNTQAGVNIRHETAPRYSPVWRAISMISGDIAGLPLHLYRRYPDDRIERPREHPVYKVFRRKPNEIENEYKFWRRRMVELLLWGSAYVYLVRDRVGRIVEALPLSPNRTEIVGAVPYSVARYWDDNHNAHDMPLENVLHLEWMSHDMTDGMDVTQYARETWAAGMAAIGFTSKFFGRGGRLGGILELPSGTSPVAKDRIEEGFRKQYNDADAAFTTVVLRDNAKFHAAQSTFEQAQMVEGRRESVRDVARFFGVAPSRLGEESGSSYNSKSEDNRDYLDTTLAPFLRMITAELNQKALTDEESWPTSPKSPELYWEHNTAAFLRMNTSERMATYGVAIVHGIMSPNEARRAENMNPRPGGDVYGNPNTTSGGVVKSEPAPAPATSNTATTALVDLLADAACRFADIVFDRVQRKAGSSRDFEGLVIDGAEDRRAKYNAAVARNVEACSAALGHPIGEEVHDAYCVAVESRLALALDKVPAVTLGELKRIRVEALSDLMLRIKTIGGER